MVTKPYCFQILFCKSNDSNSEHDHFTISDCFHLSILTGVLKINIPIIDTFDICAPCNIRKTLPTYRRDRWSWASSPWSGDFGRTQQPPPEPTGMASRKWSQALYSDVWVEGEEQQMLKQEMFRLEKSVNFFPFKTVQQWHRLPTKAVQSLFSQVFRSHLIQTWTTRSDLIVTPGQSRRLRWAPHEVPSNLSSLVILCFDVNG